MILTDKKYLVRILSYFSILVLLVPVFLTTFKDKYNAPVRTRQVDLGHSELREVKPNFLVASTSKKIKKSPRRVERASRSKPPVDDVWLRLAKCESTMNRYAVNHAGNVSYYSYFQWHLPTWYSMGYTELPAHYGYGIQKQAAKRLQARYGWGQWPGCAKELGLL